MANLTVRLDDDLKRDAEEACAYLGTSITDVIRHALKQQIHQYRQDFIKNNAQKVLVMESEGAAKAHDLLVAWMEFNGGKFVQPPEVDS